MKFMEWAQKIVDEIEDAVAAGYNENLNALMVELEDGLYQIIPVPDEIEIEF